MKIFLISVLLFVVLQLHGSIGQTWNYYPSTSTQNPWTGGQTVNWPPISTNRPYTSTFYPTYSTSTTRSPPYTSTYFPTSTFRPDFSTSTRYYPTTSSPSTSTSSSFTYLACSEYSTGQCNLYFYGSKTYTRFIPYARDNTRITQVTLYGMFYVLRDDICKAFPNLERLNLNGARIGEILPGSFDKCTKVKYIDLSKNNIRRLPRGLFKYNNQLNYLSIRNNQLKGLDTTIFANLSNLQTLSLSGNYLTEFSAELVKFNKKLSSIDLVRNDLLDLDEEKLIKYLPNLYSLAIDNNQLACSRLQEIKDYLEGSDVKLLNYYHSELRKRYYLQDTLDNYLCLPTAVWVDVYNQHKALLSLNHVQNYGED